MLYPSFAAIAAAYVLACYGARTLTRAMMIAYSDTISSLFLW